MNILELFCIPEYTVNLINDIYNINDINCGVAGGRQ
jgi:hypothetical protein